MREMKDSGVPWIGEIPKGWIVAPLWQTLRRRTEIGHPDEVVLSLYRDLGIVPKDSRDDNHNVTSLDTSTYKFVRIGDFVINKMKAWQGSMAVSAYQGIVSPAYHVCEFISKRVNPEFLHYLLRNPSYLPEYGRLSSGLRIGQWDLSYDDFKNIPHIIPPLAEQQRIVDVLKIKCAEIDSILEKTLASIEEYKKLKQSVITEAVTKGIRENRPMKDSGVEWIGNIPREWHLVRLRFLSQIFTGDQDTQDNNPDGEYPFYVRSPLVEHSNRWTFEGPAILMAGDGAGAGRVFHYVNGKYGCHQRVYSIQHIHGVSRRVLYYYLKEFFYIMIETANSKSTVDSVRLDMLKDFPICIAPEKEQQEIATYLDEKCAAIDSLIASKEALITELETYKKSLIYEYVTGKKEVPESPLA